MIDTPEFIRRARATHGDRYDYSQAEYKGWNEKVTVICPEHGPFYPLAGNHMTRSGCPKCGRRKANKKSSLSLEQFIVRAKEKHGDKYDYSQVKYVNMRTPVTIICPEHGPFKQKPLVHLSGSGCRECQYSKRRLTKESFIARAEQIHGNKYDYSFVEYKNNHAPVKIVCPKHGAFMQAPSAHLLGAGCRQCGYIRSAQKRTRSVQRRLEEFRTIHGDKYVYDLSTIGRNDEYMRVYCPNHGWFGQLLMSHLAGSGCRKCANEQKSINRRASISEFIEKAREVHGKAYDYSRVEYKNSYTPVEIICPKHGSFLQTPGTHLRGRGCPQCANQRSRFEEDILGFLQGLGLQVVRRAQGVLAEPCGDRHEIDLWLPEQRVGVECHGTMWHSSRYDYPSSAHMRKAKGARAAGVRLLQIFSHDWYSAKQAILKDIIRRACRVPLPTQGARTFSLVRPTPEELATFLERNHVRGAAYGLAYGLQDQVGLAAVLVVGKEGVPSIRRFCVRQGIHMPGAFERLFAAYIKEYAPAEVRFYVDRLLFDGALPRRCGFQPDGEVPPRYFYVDSQWRYAGDRRRFQKAVLAKRFPEAYDPQLTEREIAERAGYYRVYDAGYDRLVWRRK